MACVAASVARAGEARAPKLRGSADSEIGIGSYELRHSDLEQPIVAPDSAAADGDNLPNTVSSAVTSSPKLKAADREVKAANFGVLKQWSSFLPTVSVNGQVARGTLANRNLVDTQAEQTNRLGSVSLNLPLFSGGQTYYGIKSADSLFQAASLERVAVASDVAVETATAYLQYLLAEKTTRVVGSVSNRMKRLVTAMRERRNAGFASDADVAQVVAEDAMLVQQLAEARTNAEKARVQAESLAGRPVVFVAELPSLEQYLPSDPADAGAIAAAANPRAAAAFHSANAALYSSRAAAGKLLPQVNLVGQVRHNFDPLATVNRTAWQVSVQLSAPIIDTPNFFDYLQRDASAAATQFKADDTLRQTRAQAESLWRQYRGDGARLKAAEVRTNSLRRVADTYDKMFEAGLAPLDSVLEKYRLLSLAAINLEQTRMQRYASLCQLLALLGKFEPSMLAKAD